MWIIRTAAAFSFLAGCCAGSDTADLARYVNPFIGTGEGATDFSLANAAGNTPPGAAYPFGMALWSPDTTNSAGGYRYSHRLIRGFSMTHISGRGIACYQDVPILPVPGSVSVTAETLRDLYSEFDHSRESARPGSYSVSLNNGTAVDLTVTQRTGFGRFTFPAGDGTVVVNAGGSAQGNRAEGTAIWFAGPRQIAGSVVSGDCGGSFTYRLFFAIEFDRPFESSGFWKDGSLLDASWSYGSRSGAFVTFNTRDNPVVYAKVGISYTGVNEAWDNLRAENPGWDLESVRAAASAAWNSRLNSIQVSGGTDDQKTIFYTALYHTFIHPSTFSDAGGSYLGFDNQTHMASPRTQYHNFAGWDTYRSQMPLMAMLAPEASDMAQSLVNDAVQDPSGGLPRWQHANTNSGGMLGDSQDPVIASLYALGARDFDTASALAAMDRGARIPDTMSAGQIVRPGLQEYMTLGYVSTAIPDSGSLTLEYATDDFAISQFALAIGDRQKAQYYRKRAQNWRNLVQNGYLVPRNPDGSFISDPQPWSGIGFCEGSLAQYSLMVPFNLRALFDSMGGNDAAIRRLDYYFARLNDGSWSEHAFMGNSPSMKAPWAYHFAGAPNKSQEIIRRILTTLFRNEPAGLPGNDDLGTTSAWAVFGFVGLYPHTPGVGGVIATTPMFPRITIRLAPGSVIEIEAPGAETKPYIASLQVNGISQPSPWIAWDTIAKGATLRFNLSDAPGVKWGSGPAEAPPSFNESARKPSPGTVTSPRQSATGSER